MDGEELENLEEGEDREDLGEEKGGERRKSRKDTGPFWLSFGISFFLLLTAAGCVAVDFQGRRLTFGDDSPPIAVEKTVEGGTELEIRAFGVKKTVDMTKISKFFDFLCDFSCIPHS